MKGNSFGGRTIGRRRFLAESSIALVSASTGLGVFGRTAVGEAQFIEVETSCGRVRGAQAEGFVTFKGIPYAGSVSGRNRFKAGPPLPPWTGVPRPAAWGSVDAAEPKSAERTAACRGLPLPERLDAGGRRTQAPGHVLQPRRRLHDRFGWSRLPGWEQPCAHVGRRGRRDEPQTRSHGLLVPWPPGRGGVRHVGQPGPAWISATG